MRPGPYSLLLFLLVLEVQSKCKKYKVYFGGSKYVFETMLHENEADRKHGKQTVEEANFLVQ